MPSDLNSNHGDEVHVFAHPGEERGLTMRDRPTSGKGKVIPINQKSCLFADRVHPHSFHVATLLLCFVFS